jgi:hypothetical protein
MVYVSWLQVGTTNGAAQSMTHDNLTTSHPPLFSYLAIVNLPVTPCLQSGTSTKDTNSQPKLVTIYWFLKDERLASAGAPTCKLTPCARTLIIHAVAQIRTRMPRYRNQRSNHYTNAPQIIARFKMTVRDSGYVRSTLLMHNRFTSAFPVHYSVTQLIISNG